MARHRDVAAAKSKNYFNSLVLLHVASPPRLSLSLWVSVGVRVLVRIALSAYLYASLSVSLSATLSLSAALSLSVNVVAVRRTYVSFGPVGSVDKHIIGMAVTSEHAVAPMRWLVVWVLRFVLLLAVMDTFAAGTVITPDRVLTNRKTLLLFDVGTFCDDTVFPWYCGIGLTPS